MPCARTRARASGEAQGYSLKNWGFSADVEDCFCYSTVMHRRCTQVKNTTSITEEGMIPTIGIPERTKEYTLFQCMTQENQKLTEVIKQYISMKPGDLVLDVGGRDGNVAFAVQEAQWVHIIDPDPTIQPLKRPGKFWNQKVQHVHFSSKKKYKLIICCHVLGYLGLQDSSQETTVKKLLDLLAIGGTLLLFYNTNEGYTGDLLEYSRHILPVVHYDYFQEKILQQYRTPQYNIKQLDVVFTLNYKTWDDLARCCWFLFGSMNPNTEAIAKKFLPKLQNDLVEPTLTMDQRIIFVTRQPNWTMQPYERMTYPLRNIELGST